MALTAFGLGVASLVVIIATDRLELLRSPDAWLPISASLVGWLVVHLVPRNPVGWLLLAMSVSSALFGASALLVTSTAGDGSLGTLAAWLSTWVWLPSYLLGFWFVPMLFPDGRSLTRRWRPVVVGSTVLLAVEAFLLAFGSRESVDPAVANPFVVTPVATVLSTVEPMVFLSMMLLVALGVLTLVLRFVRSSGQLRIQVLTVLVAAAVGVGYYLLTRSGIVLAVILPLAIALAVLRYRLYDVERLLVRTLLYGGLAITAAAVYVVVLLASTRLLGASDDLRVQAAVIALAVLVIHPLRDRFMQLADRVVHGRRPDPFRALSTLARQLGSVSPEETLPVMASAVAQALTADRVMVRAQLGDGEAATAEAGVGATAHSSTSAGPSGCTDLGALGRRIVASRDVRHHGEVVGSIEVVREVALTPPESDLLDILAAQAGPALRTVGLTAMLRDELDRAVRTAAQLRESRARLVTAHDSARRKIERDLHDGAQQGLLAIAVEVGRIQRRVTEDPVDAVLRLGELQDLARRTLVELRALAAGTYPPVLRELGIGAALRERTDALDVAVRVDDLLAERPSAGVESAVYFSCLEALTNAVKHARATNIRIDLRSPSPGQVEFTITDDGAGFDPTAVRAGSGLAGIADRLGVLDGGMTVESTPGGGTSVRGRVYDADAERYISTA